MKLAILLGVLIFSLNTLAQSSMRRCTLLPVTDSVGGAISYKVFEEVEQDLKGSEWCTYVSNSSLINIFSRYRDSLDQHIKSKEVIRTVADKLKVGSLLVVTLKSELKGIEVEFTVFGDNGEDLYFSEKTLVSNNDVESIGQTIKNWLELYSKMIPYDAQITGVLGDQITMDVGKSYPIKPEQKFIVKRATNKKKHPLLKKIVDWETATLAEGKVTKVSDIQALGEIRVYKGEARLNTGDWVRLEEFQGTVVEETGVDEKKVEGPGSLGILSLALFGSSSSVDTNTPSGSNRMSGNLFGIDFRVEGWITRQYFAALEIERSLGSLRKKTGSPDKSEVNVNNGIFKLTGGYKYLPIGFFYGPQVDIYGGYVNHSFDLDYSQRDGFGKNSITGLLFGTAANIPISREYRFTAQAEFIPFPSFNDEDNVYGGAKSVSAMELELGLKYQYNPRMTIDGSVETLSRKAKFGGEFKEVSYKDNRLKIGVSFNF